jgi:hypothetical protein
VEIASKNRLALLHMQVQTLMLALSAALLAPPQPVAAQATGEAARRADIAQFRTEFLARDRAYVPAARQQAERRLAALEARVADIDTTRFGLELAQIVALADNGHTLSYAGPRAVRSARVDIRLAPLGGDFVVLRTRAADADLLGARLLAIDGVPLERLREVAHTLTGGVPAWRDRQAPLFFESPQQLQALGLIQDGAAAVYRFITGDGRTVERRLLAVAPGPDRAHADVHRLLLPGVIPEQRDGADTGWRALLPLARAPWSLQEAEQALRWRAAPDIDALVIDLRQTHSSGAARLPAFFGAVRAAVREHRPRHLVLDLRLNGGGDLTQARDFAESLPSLVDGTVWVLTSPATFSAAISISGYLKQAAPTRVLIVGEALGDRLEFFAEGRPIRLVNSGEVLLPATERHDYKNGCRAYTDCHPPVVSRPISVQSLAPDIEAPWTLDTYRRGVDPAMEAVAAALRKAP